MLLKQRIRQVSTPENPSGYKEAHDFTPTYESSVDDNGSVVSEKTEREKEAISLLKGLSQPSICITADNLELWQHDEKNLMVLVRAMFHPHHYPFAEQEFRAGSPVPYYYQIYNHMFGRLAADLDKYEPSLQQFHPNVTVDFVSDYQRWNDIMDEIRLIHERDLPESRLQAFLDLHYTNDPRPHIQGALDHARNSDWTYEQTIQALVKADERAPKYVKKQIYGVAKGNHTEHKVDHNSQGQPQYCNKFQEGTCTRGKSCKYKHEIRQDHNSKAPAVKQELKQALVKPVTQDYRQDYRNNPYHHPSIGAPAGVKSEKNKFGYSKAQRANIEFMNSQSVPSTTDKSEPFSSWSNDSQPGHKNERSDLRSFRVQKRKHTSDDDQSETSDNSPQPDT
jgi:Zinc finger C-x8-C-x5-C-x3-H type (and similar)